jgi:hypothetical protein
MVATQIETHAETKLALQAQHIMAAHSIALAMQTGDTPFSSPPDCLFMVGPPRPAHHLETKIQPSFGGRLVEQHLEAGGSDLQKRGNRQLVCLWRLGRV